MHDSTRRLICRVAFVAFCLVPSGVLTAWALYRASPLFTWHARSRWQAEIYRRTGLVAHIGSMRHPTPRRTVFENLTLFDTDGSRRLAQLRVLEVVSTDQGTVLLVSQPEIAAHQMHRLGELFVQRVLCGQPTGGEVRMFCNEATIRGEGTALTLTNVTGVLAAESGQLSGTLEWQLAGRHSAPAQLRVVHQHDPAPRSSWQLRTGSARLPCQLWRDFLPGLSAFGDECQFQGNGWLDEHEGTWDAEVAGRFTNVDLVRLMAPFPHKLSGVGELALSHARVRDGKLIEAAGEFHSDGGVVSHSLLAAAADALGWTCPLEAADDPPLLHHYRELAFGFQASADQLRIVGRCQTDRPGVVMTGAAESLLLDAREATIPGVALTRALVPQTELWVPATPATEWLLRVLPLPPAAAAADRTARQPYSPLRLRK